MDTKRTQRPLKISEKKYFYSFLLDSLSDRTGGHKKNLSKDTENPFFVSVFDIKFIRRDQKQRRNGEACRAVIENIMLVSLISSLSGETRTA